MNFSLKRFSPAFGLLLAGSLGSVPAIALDSPESTQLKQSNEEISPEAAPSDTQPEAKPDSLTPESQTPENQTPESASPLPTESAVPVDEQASIEKIQQLLEITEANELSLQVMEALLSQFQQMAPEVPNDWWERFMAEVNVEELDELIIPIYQENYTETEIDAMIAFYETPEGQSIIKKTPMVTRASAQAGQAWGLEIAQRIITELEAEGFSPAGRSAPTPEPVPEAPAGATSEAAPDSAETAPVETDSPMPESDMPAVE